MIVVAKESEYHVMAYVACMFRSSMVGARPSGTPCEIIDFICPALPSDPPQSASASPSAFCQTSK